MMSRGNARSVSARLFFRVGFAVLALLLLAPLVAWWAISAEQLQSLLESQIKEKAAVGMDVGPIAKDFFPGMTVASLAVPFRDRSVVLAGPIHVGPRWTSLLRGKLVLKFSGKSFGGDLSARVGLFPEPLHIDARTIGAGLRELGTLVDVDVTGVADVSLRSADGKQFLIRFGIYEVLAGPGLQKRIPLLVKSLSAVEGEAQWKPAPGVLDITSTSMEGDGVYATLKGAVRRETLDLVLVFTPTAPWLEQQVVVDSLLKQYQQGPGVFVIPIRGTLRNPKIGPGRS